MKISVVSHHNEPSDWLVVSGSGEIVGKHIEGDVVRARARIIEGMRCACSYGKTISRGYNPDDSYRLSIQQAFDLLG